MQHVGVVPLFGIVPVRRGFHVVHKGVIGSAGGIHRPVQDLAESREAYIARTGSPDQPLNGIIFLYKAKFECVGAVIHDNYIFKIVAYQPDHVLFRVVQLEIVVAFVPVAIVFGVVGIDLTGRHVLRDIVVAFTSEAGDDDHRGIGEVLCIFNQLIAVVLYRRLRKIPVLCRDGYGSAVRCKGRIKVNQLLVYLKPGILNAFDQAHFCIQIIDTAGTRSSVNRVG